jgi:hypothetical protein
MELRRSGTIGKETTQGLFKHSLDQISLMISDKIFK